MRLTGAYSRVITLLGGSMQPLALRGMSSSVCLVQGVQDGRPLCALGWRRAQSDWFLPFYIVNSAIGLGLLFLLAGYFVLFGCGFIDAGRCMTGGYSKLTMQIDCARNHAHESAPISSNGSRTSPRKAAYRRSQSAIRR
jgi:hypothetical protein